MTNKTNTYVVYTTINKRREYISLNNGRAITLSINEDVKGDNIATVEGHKNNQITKLIALIGKTAYDSIVVRGNGITFQTVAMYDKAVVSHLANEQKKAEVKDLANGIKDTNKAVSILRKVDTALRAKKDESLRKKKKEVFTLCDEYNVNNLPRKQFFDTVVSTVEALSTYTMSEAITKFVNDIK